jgi:hypothetical protein
MRGLLSGNRREQTLLHEKDRLSLNWLITIKVIEKVWAQGGMLERPVVEPSFDRINHLAKLVDRLLPPKLESIRTGITGSHALRAFSSRVGSLLLALLLRGSWRHCARINIRRKPSIERVKVSTSVLEQA